MLLHTLKPVGFPTPMQRAYLPLVVGNSVITATYNGFSDTADLSVTAAVLESIEVMPNPIEVGIGSDRTGTLTANGYYSDGTTLISLV